MKENVAEKKNTEKKSTKGEMGNRHQCIQIIFVSCFKKLNFSYYICSAITDIAKDCVYVHLYLSFGKKENSSFCFFSELHLSFIDFVLDLLSC